ncbi:Y-family DNA polymerase [Kineobactrum salinum]|uniref:DNA polymerase Y family protein n=1 Tax=Kineobactrum salinum TaxID=2708301 RepID=A0A6C0TYB4_9GAMM|nr:DNA polymerase Y family protein [Kineobactrum salinum]QIB64820.1 DNA polymerase Y family protein [Kineobactrum salinum]
MSLWLCLRFDQLPLQCQIRNEQRPIAVLERQRAVRVNDCALGLGLRTGMATATLRALAAPQPLQLLERDRQAEQRCLKQLCCWAYGFTPTLYPWREDCLILEIGGSLALFRGLEALLDRIHNDLNWRGYQVRTGLAATPSAAWLLSFIEEADPAMTEQGLRQVLAPLPLALLLDDFPRQVTALRRAGLKTLGAVLNLPETALGRRCGPDFVLFLRRVLGREADLQAAFRPPPTFFDQYWFGYEVKTNAELLPAVQQLLQALCRFLRHTQLQTGEIEWQLVGVDRQLQCLRVRSSTSHSDWLNWYQLSQLQFERVQLSGSVEGLQLECPRLNPGHSTAIDLFSPQNQREPLEALVDRLRGRLGLQAIARVSCRDEHLPELALQVSNDHPGAAPADNRSSRDRHRPFWLMPQPQPLPGGDGQLHWNGPLQLTAGPERIEDNWWQIPVSRDYYIARAPAGQCYWVFRDRLGQRWYIHGLFA